jgi:outer membrane protein assembly factor BamB
MRTGVSTSRIPRKPSLLWVKEVGPSVSSPLFVDGTIYVSTITGRIFALNLSEKEIKWHLYVGSPIVSSPLIYNGILVAATYDSWIKDTSFTGKNFLLGIDSNYGTQIWNYEISGGVSSSPCLVGNGMTIVVGSMNKFIYAIEGKSGNILWTFETWGEVWSSPSYNGNEIFIGSDDGFLYCLDLDGKLIWKTKLNGKIRSSSPCLSFDDESSSLFIGTYNGGMFCLNQSTGVIKWYKQISKPVMSSPATTKDKVFFAASDKRIYCFHVEDGSRVWEFETEDKIWSSPTLDSHIYGVDINTGRQTWKFPTMNMLDSSAAIASNMMLIGSRDGLLYLFGLEITPSYIR